MAKSDMIRARIEPDLKKEVSLIFKELGLTTTQAVTLFYKMVKLNRGIPFDLKIPNKKTRQVFRQTDKGENLREWDGVDEFIDEMEPEC